MKPIALGVTLFCASLAASMPPLAAQAFPEAGRTITMIVPFAAGGGTDAFARTLAPVMAEELGVPIEIVNKPGASSQVGLTELVNSEPDGYTLGWIIFPTSLAYLDPDRGSAYQRDDFQPIGTAFEVSNVVAVRKDSPYATVQELVDAAKASPGTIRAGTPGLLSTGHLASLGFQRALGIKFADVNFQGGAPNLTALLGGHVDVAFLAVNEALPQLELAGGEVKVLGVMSDEDNPYGLPTLVSQGFDVPPFAPDVGVVGPAGMPEEAVAAISAALHAAQQDEEVVRRAAETGNSMRILDPEQYAEHWQKAEEVYKPLIDLAKQQAQ